MGEMIFIIYVILYILILGTLIWTSYKDYKETIIPNTAVVIIGLASAFLYFSNSNDVVNYIYYFLYPSGLLLLLSVVIDFIYSKKKNILDIIILIFCLGIAILVPLDFKLKYILFFVLFLLFSFIKDFFISEEEVENISVGGGDIKLIAVLSPILQEYVMVFLLISMFLAYVFMKIKKEKKIFMAPFMTIAFVGCIIIKFLEGGI